LASKEEKIIAKLTDFGLNKYEAQAYLSLLQKANETAYQISKNSSVPQSKIYESMKNLVNKGLAVTEDKDPVKYSALPVKEFLQRYKNNVEESIDFIESNIQDVSSGIQIDYMWHLNGQDEVITKVRNIINTSREKLSLEIWQEEFKLLVEELKKAEKRGVEVVLIFYGDSKINLENVYYHEMEGMEEQAQKGRWLTVIKDQGESLFAIFKEISSYGVWTQNKSFMIMAESFISHDIYIAEIYRYYRDLLDNRFGPNLKSLREKVAKFI